MWPVYGAHCPFNIILFLWTGHQVMFTCQFLLTANVMLTYECVLTRASLVDKYLFLTCIQVTYSCQHHVLMLKRYMSCWHNYLSCWQGMWVSTGQHHLLTGDHACWQDTAMLKWHAFWHSENALSHELVLIWCFWAATWIQMRRCWFGVLLLLREEDCKRQLGQYC